jgi:GT2 family glycosyltransferase
MTVRVSVIILNWNGRHFLERCLRSLLAQTLHDFEIVVVDNGSKDGSVPFLEEHFPQVRVIVNQENLGFAAANNQAIRATDSEFVATLNNDTEVEPNWLEELVRAAETNGRIGACASKMLFAHDPGMINSTGIALDRAGIAWDRRGGEQDDSTETGTIEVFGACAGAALYRRAMLDEIGLFDEAFFAYLEDVDLAWRAQWANWKTLFVPTARVLHFHSGTGKEGSRFKNWHLGRNKVWAIVKNYPWPQMVLWYLPIILLYDLASIPYTLIWRGDWGAVLGRLAGLAKLGTAWKAYQAVRPLRQISGWQMVSRMAPLAPPWIVWQRYAHLREGWWGNNKLSLPASRK